MPNLAKVSGSAPHKRLASRRCTAHATCPQLRLERLVRLLCRNPRGHRHQPIHPVALVVPESAVVFDREGTYVWKLDAGNVPAKVPIQVGLRRNGRVEVTLGLVAGDTIVTTGTHKVMAGKRVALAAPLSMGQARGGAPHGGSAGEGT